MSTQKGNIKRSRPQKYQNIRKFNNQLYDKSHKTKKIVATEILGACKHCREVLEWKITYKKYKIMANAKTWSVLVVVVSSVS